MGSDLYEEGVMGDLRYGMVYDTGYSTTQYGGGEDGEGNSFSE